MGQENYKFLFVLYYNLLEESADLKHFLTNKALNSILQFLDSVHFIQIYPRSIFLCSTVTYIMDFIILSFF